MTDLPATTDWRSITFLDALRFHIVFDAAADDLISRVYAEGRFPHSPYSTLLPHWLKPGMAVLDLGAHIGSFALVAAALGCRVLAVEACPRNAILLRASAERNGFTRLQVVQAAVSDRPGTLEFCSHGPFGFVVVPGFQARSEPVRAVTVDDLLDEMGWSQVDLVKMDVEGSEVAAVWGMKRLLARPEAPPLIYESNGHTLHWFGQTPMTLKAALERFGYRNYLIEPGRLVPERAEDVQPCVVTDNLAAKHLPPLSASWQVCGRPSKANTVTQIVAAAASPEIHQRLHLARSLQNAPAWIRDEPSVRQVLCDLHQDPVAEVREAVASADARQLPPRRRGLWARWWRRTA